MLWYELSVGDGRPRRNRKSELSEKKKDLCSYSGYWGEYWFLLTKRQIKQLPENHWMRTEWSFSYNLENKRARCYQVDWGTKDDQRILIFCFDCHRQKRRFPPNAMTMSAAEKGGRTLCHHHVNCSRHCLLATPSPYFLDHLMNMLEHPHWIKVVLPGWATFFPLVLLWSACVAAIITTTKWVSGTTPPATFAPEESSESSWCTKSFLFLVLCASRF